MNMDQIVARKENTPRESFVRSAADSVPLSAIDQRYLPVHAPSDHRRTQTKKCQVPIVKSGTCLQTDASSDATA